MAKTKEKMPEPATIDYTRKFKILDAFITDLQISLGDLEFSKADAFVRFAVSKKEEISIADLNEFIKKIEQLPYRFVAPLIANIRNQETFVQYFEETSKGKDKDESEKTTNE